MLHIGRNKKILIYFLARISRKLIIFSFDHVSTKSLFQMSSTKCAIFQFLRHALNLQLCLSYQNIWFNLIKKSQLWEKFFFHSFNFLLMYLHNVSHVHSANIHSCRLIYVKWKKTSLFLFLQEKTLYPEYIKNFFFLTFFFEKEKKNSLIIIFTHANVRITDIIRI